MTLLEKIVYLQNSLHLSDSEFEKRFEISKGTLKKWKDLKKTPTINDVAKIADEFNVDLEDFASDSSTILYNLMKTNEHPCKVKKQLNLNKDFVSEDFGREDNARYEEKD